MLVTALFALSTCACSGVQEVTPEKTVYEGRQSLTCFALLPGGLIAVADRDGKGPGVMIAQAASGKVVGKLSTDRTSARSLAASLDGTILGVSYFETAIWDLGKQQALAKMPSRGPLALSPDGATMAVLICGPGESKRIGLFEVGTGRLRRSLRGRFFVDSCPQNLLAFSRDGAWLAVPVGKEDGPGEVLVWDLRRGGPKATLAGHKRGVRAVMFSPTDDRLFSSDGEVFTWDVEKGKRLGSFQTGAPDAPVAISPDGALVAAVSYDPSFDETGRVIAVREIATGKLLVALVADPRKDESGARAVRMFIDAVAFGPDGKTIYGMDSTSIRRWVLPNVVRSVGRVPPRPKAGPSKRDPRLTTKTLAEMWESLARADDESCQLAYEHIGAMVLSPQTSLPFLKSHLKPVCAAELSQVEAWVASLDSDDFDEREAATRALEKAGVLIAPVLREKKAAGKLSLEADRRLATVLANLDKQPVDPDELRGCRAVEVLFGIGNAEATVLLRELSKGAPGSLVTQQAKRSLFALSGK